MTNILFITAIGIFGVAIGLWMVALIWGAYCWMVCRGYILVPSQEVRDLVDEYARLKAEFRGANTEERREAILDRKRDVAIKLAEMDYVLYDTGKAAYVFPIDDY